MFVLCLSHLFSMCRRRHLGELLYTTVVNDLWVLCLDYFYGKMDTLVYAAMKGTSRRRDLDCWLCRSFLVTWSCVCRVDFGDTRLIKSGWPQASVLRPLLFSLSVNGLATSVQSPGCFFVDGSWVVGLFGWDDLGENIVQILNWTETWDLSLNARKSHLISKKPKGAKTIHGDDLSAINTASNWKGLVAHATSDFKWTASETARG